MKKSAIILGLALGVSAWSVMAQEKAAAPAADEPPAKTTPAGGSGEPAGPGGRGFHLLPPRAQEQLNLTADQHKQLADLEKEMKAKLEKILTPEQLEKLKQMRPMLRQARRGMGGPGMGGPGMGGPGMGGPGMAPPGMGRQGWGGPPPGGPGMGGQGWSGPPPNGPRGGGPGGGPPGGGPGAPGGEGRPQGPPQDQ